MSVAVTMLGWQCQSLKETRFLHARHSWLTLCSCRGSLRRLGVDQIALGQLHWSVAKYAPPLERVLWEGLAGMYEQVCLHVISASVVCAE